MPRGSKGRREARRSPRTVYSPLLVRALASVPELAAGITFEAWLSGETPASTSEWGCGIFGFGVLAAMCGHGPGKAWCAQHSSAPPQDRPPVLRHNSPLPPRAPTCPWLGAGENLTLSVSSFYLEKRPPDGGFVRP